MSDEKLENLYRFDDWKEISAPDPNFLIIQGVRVPYVVFENEDDVTTERDELLSKRLENTLGRLWSNYASNPDEV
jgi:SRSO17 transposase